MEAAMRSSRALDVRRVDQEPLSTRSRFHGLLALPLLVALSCTGQIGDDDPAGGGPNGTGSGTTTGGSGGGSFNGTVVSQPGVTSRFVRLNHQQWENTVRDLLRIAAPLGLSTAFVAEPLRSTFDTNGSLLSVNADLWQDYQTAAETLAAKIAHDPKLLAAIVPSGAPSDLAGKAKALIQDFGRRVYRRPLTAEEVTRYVALFNKGPMLIGSTDAFVDGAELVLTGFFQSPHFLYRAELSSTVVDGKIALNDYEVASKLSYALTNSMPDDALFAAAGAKQLESREGVLEQAKRILATSVAGEMIADFHDQLLRMRDFEGIKKDEKLFPLFGAGAGADMKEEALTFIDNVIISQSQGFSELMTAPYTFANSRIARIYGLSVPAPAAGQPDPFVRVQLDASQRGGFLTQVGFLASHAEGQIPNIIMRGVHMAKDILCVDIPPPPDAIPPLPPLGANSTNRQRVETLTKNAPCSGCHPPFINPLGFAFENLSGVGAYRTQENGLPIDARGTYTIDDKMVSFDGPVELVKLIAASHQGNACYARHWVEYLYGRDIDLANEADKNLIAQGGFFSKSNPSLKELILNLVSTDAFLARLP